MFYTSTSRVPALLPLTGMRQVNRILDEALGGFVDTTENGGTLASAWVPPCDISEDGNTLRIVMEIPGVAAEDVKVSLENNRLSIRGEKRQQAESKADRVHRFERSYGVFERVFTLPTSVDGDRIEAQVRDGILTLHLPKVERARPREIPVRSATAQVTA